MATVYAGTNGAEFCSDNNQAPDGRIIVTPNYASADGDPTNPSQGNGFVRIDSSGPSCGQGKKQDSSAGRGGSCQPATPVPLPIP